MNRTVGIIGTLDTKGEEFKFLKEQIESYGVSTLVIDIGVIGEATFTPNISASEVAKAGGVELSDLVKERDRGHSMSVMAKGAELVVSNLYNSGEIDGIISMGGGGGTAVATNAMRTLPTGVPKLIVSTVASGNTRPYIGGKDIVMFYSIVDISGINKILRRVLINAAAAIAAMVKVNLEDISSGKPTAAATMFGVTTPCVTKSREILESAGYEVLVFHATGVGGQTMESLARDGLIECVLDITTTEVVQDLVGGICSAGPDRLEAVGETGIPQVVVPGAIDMVNFGSPETIPDKFKGRCFYEHNPVATLMRTTREENEQVGRIIAEKLNKAKGFTAIVIPKKGFSAIDREGQPFHDPEADNAFLQSLKTSLSNDVKLFETDNHINDDEFAVTITTLLLENTRKER
jgi:uncharacterized protein (UPF0261 family)